ncbi:unnamed protein product, partial [Brachionus calyciflorus]
MNRLNRNPFNPTGSMSSVISGNFDDDDTSSVISATHSGRPSRLHSDITLEFIDEFFNPLSTKKPNDRKITQGTNLQSATGGRGLTRDRFSSSASTTSSKSDYQFKTQEYLPFHVAREKSNNFEYAKIRQQYENKYWEQIDNQSQVGSTLRSDEMSSVVGSAMSQIESVTTISTSKSTHQKIMNQMRQIEKIN